MSCSFVGEDEADKDGEAGNLSGIVDAAVRSQPTPQPEGTWHIKLELLSSEILKPDVFAG